MTNTIATWLRLWAIATLCVWGISQASASPPLPDQQARIELVGESSGPIDIGARMAVLIDASGQWTLDEVMARTHDWMPITRPTPNFGFSQDAHWFRFTLVNSSPRAVERYLELPVPFLDDIRLFHRVGDLTVAEFQLGDERPFAQRVIRHQNFVMPLTLLPGDNQLYLRLASAGTVEASLRLWEPKHFMVASNNDNLAQGAVVGVLLVMVIYNLFIFFSLRDGNFLLYIGFVTSYTLFYFTLTGYAYQYLWPQAVRWNSIAISTFIAATIVFTCWFAASFLRLRSFSYPVFFLLRLMGLAGALLLVATFFLPYSWTIRVGTFLALPVALTALVAGYWRWFAGASFARFYCLAWSALLVGLIVLNANKLGLIEANVWTNNASQIGVILQVVLLSFTLADRMNHDRIRRIEAQDAALQHERKARESTQALVRAIEESNRQLEIRVQARTADLHHTMGQLQAANDQLKQLSTTDALTQVRNRAFFDEAWDAEVRRASRILAPVTLVMLDIDHFKNVNDTYGHPAGDACLRHVASLVASQVGRAGDVVARYGGEEFAIILIDAELAQALQWVERVRKEVEKQVLEFDGHTIRFTASFGLAHGVPQARTSPEAILGLADKALYHAKHEGRNCVRHETL